MITKLRSGSPRRRVVAAVATTVAVLTGGACGSSSDGSSLTVLTPSHPTATVSTDDRFRLSLPENAGTGYHWVLDTRPQRSIARSLGSAYVAGGTKPGAPGRQTFTFRARGTGTATVIVAEYPPGSGTEPDRKVTFTVTVH
ncbi:MAG: Chagasin family peptidase inhibitor [Actinomycetia bacterium]|nr:Chagasin family peptidase inhibitor [Actinomycetes bacterium]